MPRSTTTATRTHRAAAGAAVVLFILGAAAPAGATRLAAPGRDALRATPTLNPDQVAPLSDPGVELTAPADGRLRGAGVALVVTGAALTNVAGTGGQEVAAGGGQELLVFGLRSVAQTTADNTAGNSPPYSLAVVSAGQRRTIDVASLSGNGPWYFAVTVPKPLPPTAAVDLELSADGYDQDFALTTLARTGPQPEILYRDPAGPEVVDTDTSTVPLTVNTGPPDSSTYHVPLGAATTTIGWFTPDGSATAPAVDQAILDVQLQTAMIVDPSESVVLGEFTGTLPADHVQLVLADGTTVPAGHLDAPNQIGAYFGLFTGDYYFTVPADIVAASVRVDPYTEYPTGGAAAATLGIAALTLPLHLPSSPPPTPATTTAPTTLRFVDRPQPSAGIGGLGTAGHGTGQAPLWVVAILLAGAAAVVWRILAKRRHPAAAGPAALTPPAAAPWVDIRPPARQPVATPAGPPAPPRTWASEPGGPHPPPGAAPDPVGRIGGERTPSGAAAGPAEGFDQAEATTSQRPPELSTALPSHPPWASTPPPAPTPRPPLAEPTPAAAVRTGEGNDTVERIIPPRPPDAPTPVSARQSTAAIAPTPPPGPLSPAAAAPAHDTPSQRRREAGGPPSRLRIDILGPCQVSGLGSAKLRPREVEVLVYLALADKPVTNDDIRAAVAGPSDTESSTTTVRTWLSRLRSAVGTDVLPDADYGRYRLAGADTDVAQFRQLLAKADATTDPAETARTLCDALNLVQGRPFDGTDYRWTHLHIAGLETVIADTADRLSTLATSRHDPAVAAWAAERGLAAVGHPDDRLLAHLLRAGAQQGPVQLAQAWKQVIARCAHAGDAPGPDLTALYHHLRSGAPA